MDIRERDTKATQEHWTIVVIFFETYPKLLKRTFANQAEDNAELRGLWETLTSQLNSTGHGIKSVAKWQEAISRWKSKVKSKAATFRSESQKTGGGPSLAPPLTDIKERLMNIYGWRSVSGDGNTELGFKTGKANRKMDKAMEVPPSPPPLAQIASTSSSSTATKRKTGVEKMIHLKKLCTQTEKTKRFVSINRMHAEKLEILKQIDNKVGNFIYLWAMSSTALHTSLIMSLIVCWAT